MSYSSASLVRKVIEVDDTISLLPYLDAAAELVAGYCEGKGYTATRLEMIETWLAAHFYAVRDPRTQSEGVATLQTTYQGRTGMYFDSSTYGQHALLLDTAGGLAALQASIKEGYPAATPRVTWLGRND